MIGKIRAFIYDRLIVKMTSRWYRAMLTRCPANAVVLDVGVGTATSLLHNKSLILEKNISFVGVDYDAQYIAAGQNGVDAAKLNSHVRLVAASIFDYVPLLPPPPSAASSAESSSTFRAIEKMKTNLLFDVIYFSGSFMIIPDKVRALKHTVAMLKSATPAHPQQQHNNHNHKCPEDGPRTNYYFILIRERVRSISP